jgi:phosphatidylserine decarboxylase
LPTTVAVALCLAVAALVPGLTLLWAVGAALGVILLFFLWFFRDPDRTVTAPGTSWTSPADGTVSRIDQVDDPDLGRCDRLAIFMSPVDVHVNRYPQDGQVVSIQHVAGGHIPAFDKDSDKNERVVLTLDTAVGRVKVIQIAGTVARRIVPYIDGPGQATRGERYGLIRFGSRCDIHAPVGTLRWTVSVGDKLQGGLHVVAQPASATGAP